MSLGDIISQGLSIAALGMGTVFSFLILLVICTTLMSRIIQKLFPHVPQAPSPAGTTAATSNNTITAVITAAIHAHRQKKSK